MYRERQRQRQRERERGEREREGEQVPLFKFNKANKQIESRQKRGQVARLEILS